MIYILQIFRKVVIQLLPVLLMTGVCFSQFDSRQKFVYYNKGEDQAIKGNFEEAKIQFEKTLELDPYNNSAKLNLKIIKDATDKKIKKGTAIHIIRGLSGCEWGVYDLGIHEFSKAIANNRNYAYAYIFRGEAYHQYEEKHDRAISDFNKAIDLEPDNALAFAYRANAYYTKCYQECQYKQPDYVYKVYRADKGEPYYTKPKYYNKCQCDQAISDYKKAIEIEPQNPKFYYDIALVYAESGRKEEAIEAYRSFIKYASNIPEYAYDIKETEQKIAELQK